MPLSLLLLLPGLWTVHRDTPDYNTLSYCGKPALFSYKYSDAFDYASPVCDIAAPYEIARKGTNLVSITTAFIETHEVRWPCLITQCLNHVDWRCPLRARECSPIPLPTPYAS